MNSLANPPRPDFSQWEQNGSEKALNGSEAVQGNAESVAAPAEVVRELAALADHFAMPTVWLARRDGSGNLQVDHVEGEPVGTIRRGEVYPAEASPLEPGAIPTARLDGDVTDGGFADMAACLQFEAGAGMAAPLLDDEGAVIGEIVAVAPAPDPTLGPRDLAVFRSFAAQCNRVLNRAREKDAELATARERIGAMLDGQAVTMFHQPIHRLSDGKPVGVECLARFPDLTKRGPQAWFDDAMKTGLGEELELTAVRCAVESIEAIPEGIFAGINASPATILSGRLRAAVEQVEGAAIVIEITDHAEVAADPAFHREIEALRAFARIAIDDMGSGLADLEALSMLKPDILKLNMALTRGAGHDPGHRAIAGAFAQFAAETGALLVAEGIESAVEAEMMRELGVAYGQGYHFARPLPVVAAQQHLLGMSLED